MFVLISEQVSALAAQLEKKIKISQVTKEAKIMTKAPREHLVVAKDGSGSFLGWSVGGPLKLSNVTLNCLSNLPPLLSLQRLPARLSAFLPVPPSIHPRANPWEAALSQFLCVCTTEDFILLIDRKIIAIKGQV